MNSRYLMLEQERCPTCWEWRDAGEYNDPYYSLSRCKNCRVHAKTMIRLGILAPDERILDIFHEPVRMRNCLLWKNFPITKLELFKGLIIGETASGFPSQVVWQEDMQEWQVVDDFMEDRQ